MDRNTNRAFAVLFLTVFIVILGAYAVYHSYGYISPKIADSIIDSSDHCSAEMNRETPFLRALFHDPTAFFTMALAIFTLRLFQVTKNGIAEQAALTREAITHAGISANAAALLTEATVSAGLPQPVIYNVELRRPGVSNLDACLQANNVAVQIMNYGRSPALLNRQGIDLIVCGRLPETPPYSNVLTFSAGTVIRREDVFDLDRARPINGSILMDRSEIDDIVAGRKFLYVFGFVEYRDFLNTFHIYRFCKCLVPPTDFTNFRWYDGPFPIPEAYIKSN